MAIKHAVRGTGRTGFWRCAAGRGGVGVRKKEPADGKTKQGGGSPQAQRFSVTFTPSERHK